VDNDGLFEFELDLGKMSGDKADLVQGAMQPQCHCGHPDSAHTGTGATFPWRVCARFTETAPGTYDQCGCQVLQ
jgi:hypothetical protein